MVGMMDDDDDAESFISYWYANMRWRHSGRGAHPGDMCLPMTGGRQKRAYHQPKGWIFQFQLGRFWLKKTDPFPLRQPFPNVLLSSTILLCPILFLANPHHLMLDLLSLEAVFVARFNDNKTWPCSANTARCIARLEQGRTTLGWWRLITSGWRDDVFGWHHQRKWLSYPPVN